MLFREWLKPSGGAVVCGVISNQHGPTSMNLQLDDLNSSN